MNPLSNALLNNQTEIVKYLLGCIPNLNYKYAWARPVATTVSYKDTGTIKDEVFPLICTIVNKNPELFDYFYEKFFHCFSIYSLRLILEEAVFSESLHLVQYILNSYRTKSLFLYLPYNDM